MSINVVKLTTEQVDRNSQFLLKKRQGGDQIAKLCNLAGQYEKPLGLSSLRAKPQV